MELSKLSRRSFMGRSAVVVGGLIAAPAVLEACAPANSSSAPASGSAPAASGAAPSSSAAAAGVTSAFGVQLPADAGPKESQYTLSTISSIATPVNALPPLVDWLIRMSLLHAPAVLTPS
jgi:hypothetical protein